MPDSASGSGTSPDIFTNPSSDYWVDYPVRQSAPSEPPITLPKKNIGYFSPSVPSSVPGWRPYNPYQGTANPIPTGYDPVGWACSNCFFRLVHEGKSLCTKYRFELPLGSWRCNSYVTQTAKFTPFVKEQTPLANEDVLQLVDQQGRFLVDIYRFINVDPSGSYRFLSGYHSHTSNTHVPVFVLGPMRYNVNGTMYDVVPAVRSDWLPFQKYGPDSTGACIPMGLTERPGWIQYDIEPVTNNFINLRFLPKENQSLEFVGVGAPEGWVAMMPKTVVTNFTDGLPLPLSFQWLINWQYWFSLYISVGPKIVFSSGDDLVSSKPVLDAYGEKSVPINVNPDMFLADKVSAIPVQRDQIAISDVSTGLLGIPREETSLNLFEDINKIGLDPTRWIAKVKYQYESVEPKGWYDSYGVRNQPDEQVPENALPYETALRVESDIQNSGINLLCRVPPSTFPWHRFSSYGQSAYDEAKGKWDAQDISFPPYGSPRVNGVTSSVELTSRQYFAYQPGRITGFTFGVRACPPEFVGSNSEVLWGIENDENAMYFRLNGGVWSLVRVRFNAFNKFTQKWASYRIEKIDQGSFNGDNLNGFGPSGYVMEWNKVTMFKLEYGWYGGVGARLYAYVPVGNKSAKWVRLHDFGPPQSDSEPNTPADLKNKRYPTLSTPWFKVFYRILSSNSSINDQGMLSLSKYGVSVYIDGGNPNSPQITNVPGGIKTIPAYNEVEVTNGETITRSDCFPIVSMRFKKEMKKRVTADSIPGAKDSTTNYKVIVPKRLNVTAFSETADTSLPVRIDMWSGSEVKDSQATTGKIFSYPEGYNYSLQGMLQDPNNQKSYFFKKNSPAPWWSYLPPAYIAPDWKRAAVSGDLVQENGNSPSRPDLVDPALRRYAYADYGSGGALIRGGRVFGVSTEDDPFFYALRILEAGVLTPDTLSAFRDPYFFTFNSAPDAAEIAKVGSLNFKHADMVLVSDPIFDPYFTWSLEATGDVYTGFYFHKPSVSSSLQTANVIAKQSGWLSMLESEITEGMWPLFFTPYSLHGSYGLFGESNSDNGGRAYLDTDSVLKTKYSFDGIMSSYVYNTALTRIIRGDYRGFDSRDFVPNPEGYGVHFVVLLSPGSSVKNVNIVTNPSTNDAEQRAVRFLGQPDSKYANSWSNSFLNKIYGRSLIGEGVEWPSTTGQTAYQWIKNLKNLYTSPTFKWGRPNIEVQTKGSSDRLPVTFRDYDENSGVLIDTDSSQKLTKSKFELMGSFFIYAPKPPPPGFSLPNTVDIIGVPNSLGGIFINPANQWVKTTSQVVSGTFLVCQAPTNGSVNYYNSSNPFLIITSPNNVASSGTWAPYNGWIMAYRPANGFNAGILYANSSSDATNFPISGWKQNLSGNYTLMLALPDASLSISTQTPVVGDPLKAYSFDLSNFFSYSGTAIRGPGDYTFFVTAQNMTSVEEGGQPIKVAASMQCEEG